MSNDDIAGATLIAAFPFTVSQDTTTATSAAGDPDMGAGAGGNSNTVWYRFVAPSSGGVVASTAGSVDPAGFELDTVLAAFSGLPDDLSWIAGSDDWDGHPTSEVQFNVQSGVTYYIEVATYPDQPAGTVRLSVTLGPAIAATATQTTIPTYTPSPTSTLWPTATPYPTFTPTPTVAPAANDDIASAIQIGGLPYSIALNTAGATSASDDPDMGSDTGRNSNTVWFRLPSVSGAIRVSTAGSDYDTVVAVFSGTRGNLKLEGSNDDVANGTSTYDGTSEVVFTAVAGVTYYVEVAQYGEHGGGQLRLSVNGGTVVLATPIPSQTPAVAAFVPASPLAARSAVRDNRYFASTGFRVDNDRFWDFFNKRGGVRIFGYPVSWEFTLFGFKVQLFQRGILQQMPNGSVATMNLLDDGLMPYTHVNSSTFPAPKERLIEEAPSPLTPGYGAAAIAFIEANVPDEWNGLPVNFLKTFNSTVRYEDAFPNGEGSPELVPLLNLELWGLPTSGPEYDPANRSFVYQRFQRGILHYDATTGTTQGLLLADYLKSIITGWDLPADLEEQAMDSPFYLQYDNSQPGHLARPGELPGTDLTGAFEVGD